MSTSTSEKGHAKNIANLKLLITHITEIGANYNPSNPNITLDILQSIYDKAHLKQINVNTLQGPYKTAVAERENLFKPLNRLITKLRRVYKATQGVQPNQLENFMTIARKIKGDRKQENPESTDTTTAQTQYSVSQLSYDQRTNSLGLLIGLLNTTTNYNPNEDAYKTTTLQTLQDEMLEKTAAVGATFVPFNNARSIRNSQLYFDTNNLVDTAYTAKDYLFTILDTSSTQYKAISKIKFSRI
ncbi:hypothetical protein [Flavobacterium sp.]|uniref:hypothetical protein n=1 Tax=Flavobacterium sp. TaxID=239 RepID=UPI002FD8D61C